MLPIRTNGKKIVALVAVAIVLLIAGIFAATHSFVVINIDGASDGATTRIQLTDGEGKTSELKTRSDSIRKLVPRGGYQITAMNQDKSYLASISTKPFLLTSTINAGLKDESSRSFIGDNPGVCMYYISQRLVSGECDDYVLSLSEHVPATAASPSYARDIPGNQILGISKGIVTTKSGEQIVLTQDVEGYVSYHLQRVNSQFNGSERSTIDVGDSSAEYKVAPYKDGVLVYAANLNDFRYFSATDSKPQVIDIDDANESSLSPKSATITNDSITVLYTEEDADADDVDKEDLNTVISGISEVIAYNNNDQKHYILDSVYVSARACGTQKLCAVNAVGMSVYDISGSKPKLLYGLPGVKELYDGFSGLIATTNKGVISFDVDARQGHYNYSFGGYSPCGLLTPVSNGYILCTATTKGNRKAIFVNQTATNSDSIDKQLLSIENTPGVEEVSGVGTFVYIVPDYGDSIYDAANKVYISDPAKVKIADLAINKAINASGIDKAKYTIITGR